MGVELIEGGGRQYVNVESANDVNNSVYVEGTSRRHMTYINRIEVVSVVQIGNDYNLWCSSVLVGQRGRTTYI